MADPAARPAVTGPALTLLIPWYVQFFVFLINRVPASVALCKRLEKKGPCTGKLVLNCSDVAAAGHLEIKGRMGKEVGKTTNV